MASTLYKNNTDQSRDSHKAVNGPEKKISVPFTTHRRLSAKYYYVNNKRAVTVADIVSVSAYRLRSCVVVAADGFCFCQVNRMNEIMGLGATAISSYFDRMEKNRALKVFDFFLSVIELFNGMYTRKKYLASLLHSQEEHIIKSPRIFMKSP